MRPMPRGSGREPASRGESWTRPPQTKTKSQAALALFIAFVVAGSADLSHIVAKGENLSRIAKRYGTTARVIALANQLTNPNLIVAGQKLNIPGPEMRPVAASHSSATQVHVVVRGENLSRIAVRYKTTPSALVALNGIRIPSLIHAGQKLKVPSPYRSGVEGVLEKYSDQFGVDRALVKAVAWQESGWKQGVVSSAGAIGVMQVLPETADFTARSLLRGPVDIKQVDDNVKAGVRFFAYLLSLTRGDEQLAVAGYFQGLRSVRNEGISPKTARYVANVMALRKRFS